MVKRSIPTFIVEHRTLLREGLQALLQNTPYKVVASAASLADLPDVPATDGRPALFILGLSNGIGDSVSAFRNFSRSFPNGKIVVVADSTGPSDIQEILSRGADAIILNVSSRDVLLKAIDLTFLQQQLVVIGGQPARANDHRTEDSVTLIPEPHRTGRDDKECNGLARSTSACGLSQREQQILSCLARGQSNKMIARSCAITEATVKVHLRAILRKTTAQNRTQAAIWAVEHGLMAGHSSVAADHSLASSTCEF